MARLWANKCTFEDNNNRHVESSNFDYVGENMLATTNSSYNYTTLVSMWYDDWIYYNYANATCIDGNGDVNSEKCEGYTQVTTFEFM